MGYKGPGTYKQKDCAECGSTFEPTSGSAKYCPDCGGVAGDSYGANRWARSNPEAARAHGRQRCQRYRFKQNGWDVDVYEALVERDGEVCRICGATPDPGYFLAVDHDHETNDIRGLLCRPCNTGLGAFRDNPESLRAAIDYLQG